LPTTAPRTDAGAGTAVARLALSRIARAALVWGAVFAIVVASSVLAYRSTYGTPAERAGLLRTVTANAGVRALFGPAREIDTVTGFLAWRTLGLLPLVAGVWGLLAATRLLRGEEDSGRWETLLSGPVSRARATLASLAAVAAASALLFAVTAAGVLVGVVLGDVPLGGGLFLALALCGAAPAFAAVGALTSQLAPTRREAAALGGAVFAVAFLLRVAADASPSAHWLRWLTPMGWIVELRPLTGARPAVLLLLAGWTAGLVAAAVALARGRDAGAGILAHTDDRRPHERLLGSPPALALREALGGLVAWTAGAGLTALVFGFIAPAAADAVRASGDLRERLRGTVTRGVDLGSAEGYLAVVFVFLVLVLSLYAAGHAVAVREEESSGRLDTLLSTPLGRGRWLGGRLLVAAGCCTVVALVAAVAAWTGARLAGADVRLSAMLEAALNGLPVVALFLGLGTLAAGALPRHTGAVAFGAVGFAYLLEQTGALVQAPAWILAASPFHWLAAVPSEPFDPVASLVMLVAGAAAAGLGARLLCRRDLVPA
jgi:ABC-2 type transport system permease protein